MLPLPRPKEFPVPEAHREDDDADLLRRSESAKRHEPQLDLFNIARYGSTASDATSADNISRRPSDFDVKSEPYMAPGYLHVGGD